LETYFAGARRARPCRRRSGANTRDASHVAHVAPSPRFPDPSGHEVPCHSITKKHSRNIIRARPVSRTSRVGTLFKVNAGHIEARARTSRGSGRDLPTDDGRTVAAEVVHAPSEDLGDHRGAHMVSHPVRASRLVHPPLTTRWRLPLRRRNAPYARMRCHPSLTTAPSLPS
jgi:hypothetical protein